MHDENVMKEAPTKLYSLMHPYNILPGRCARAVRLSDEGSLYAHIHKKYLIEYIQLFSGNVTSCEELDEFFLGVDSSILIVAVA